MLKKLIIGGFAIALLSIVFTTAAPTPASAARETGKGCTAHVYKKGSRSTCVKYIQKMLNGIDTTYRKYYGSSPLVADGIFGSKVYTQVYRYQKYFYHKTGTGVVDRITWRMLCEYAGQPSFSDSKASATKKAAWQASYQAGCYVEKLITGTGRIKKISRY